MKLSSITINFHSHRGEETYLKAKKWSKFRRRDGSLHDRMLIQIIDFFTLKQKLEFLPTVFAVILTPVALANVPKLEFDFEVIMHIAIFCFWSPKSCFKFAICISGLPESIAIFMWRTSPPEHPWLQQSFDFEVIMPIAIFCFWSPKSYFKFAISISVVKT